MTRFCSRLALIVLIGVAFTLNTTGFASSDHKTVTNWISLYDGNEAQFTLRDRNRVLEALNTLGVEYRQQNSSGSILVKVSQRALIQDLISQIFTKSSRVSRSSAE